ncbi:hypothetical protein D3C78_1746640 [compost metagenome]
MLGGLLTHFLANNFLFGIFCQCGQRVIEERTEYFHVQRIQIVTRDQHLCLDRQHHLVLSGFTVLEDRGGILAFGGANDAQGREILAFCIFDNGHVAQT